MAIIAIFVKRFSLIHLIGKLVSEVVIQSSNATLPAAAAYLKATFKVAITDNGSKMGWVKKAHWIIGQFVLEALCMAKPCLPLLAALRGHYDATWVCLALLYAFSAETAGTPYNGQINLLGPRHQCVKGTDNPFSSFAVEW